MKKRTRLISILSLIMLLIVPQVSTKAASTEIKVQHNNVMTSGISPFMTNGTVLVPLKNVSSLLGATVEWNAKEKAVRITSGETVNILYINQTQAYQYIGGNETKVQLSSPAIIKDGTTYVPLRYIAECLGTKVKWDKEKSTVVLQESVTFKDQEIYLGDSISEVTDVIGKSSFTLSDDTYEYLFYVADYKNVLILQVNQGILEGFTSNAESIEFRDITYGDAKQVSGRDLVVINDSHSENKIAAIGYRVGEANLKTEATLKVNERIIFELTNGFRAHQNVTALNYSSSLSKVARAHSEDMAQNNYFSHESLSGMEFSERINSAGIRWNRCGENIAAGNGTGIAVLGQWLNSWGHRVNMLEQTGDLGVGGAYDASSMYKYYFTQNFAKLR